MPCKDHDACIVVGSLKNSVLQIIVSSSLCGQQEHRNVPAGFAFVNFISSIDTWKHLMGDHHEAYFDFGEAMYW